MKKLFRFLDEKLLKFGVSFAIIFTALYPKLPSVHIIHTWVYIRLEDFLIATLAIIWFWQILRKKIPIPFSISKPFIFYWVAGFLSLLFSMVFIAPHIANYFPNVAILSYFRRIEYMILFFIAISTIKTEKDIKDYLLMLTITVTGLVLYGFGQRWYIVLWSHFPAFFEKFSFCFPSFQTGNEEFAKGIPLCLPPDARITSTFGGHYDLAGYLVFVIPALFVIFLNVKNFFWKIYMLLLTIGSVILLILTSSRISFVAYLVGISCTFIFSNKKKFIAPVLIVSIILLFTLSASTAKRFLDTIRLASIVTNEQGTVVGVTTASLSQDLQKKISKNPIIIGITPTQELPKSSSFITLPQIGGPVTTNTAVIQKSLTLQEQRRLNLANGGLELSTVNGTFLVQKALVYDISFTTRFQGEWPNAWNAFLRNPLLGSGYGTITLATDSDYFRVLGETGILGLLSFALIFMYLGIMLRVADTKITSTISRNLVYALAGGVIGLLINASFIDVFEASKIAEPLWIFLGIGAGIILLFYKEKIPYVYYLKKIFTSGPLIILYLFTMLGYVFFSSLSNFFVADDFTWLRWAASSKMKDIIEYFTNAHGFFYRPLDKLLIFVLFSLSAFKPEGYHLLMLLIHLGISFGVFLLLTRIFGKKLFAFFGAVLFLVLPSQGENVYWISTISNSLSTLFMVYGIFLWISYRNSKKIILFLFSFAFAILALLSYENSLIFPILIFVSDILLFRIKINKKLLYEYLPFIILAVAYLLLRSLVHAVPLSGDYSYNLYKFIPNSIGNFFGYLGIFIFGEGFFPGYNSFRFMLRQYWLEVLIICLGAIIGFIIVGLKRKLFFGKVMKNEKARICLYGVIFAFVVLIPFLGLGNISERYLYFASVGFIIILISVIDLLTSLFGKMYNGRILSLVRLAIMITIIFIFSFLTKSEAGQWQKAGRITQNTLSLLRTDYDDASSSSRMYFVNVPIRERNAWVFPVGLPDAIWFIYRDSSPKIYNVQTIEIARQLAKGFNGKSYIFYFDNYGMAKEIKQ